VPQRFEPTKSAYFIDGFMTYFITVGGIGVIVAVLGIFVFILSQILPLFQGARVEPRHSVQLPQASYAILGADEWTEYPILLTSEGQLS
jgi:phosphate transport system permease protein